MANVERAEKIKHWMDMGPEKMADQMWKLFVQCNRLKYDTRRSVGDERLKDAKQHAEKTAYDQIVRQNEILKDVLQDSGIRPKKLEITYVERDCERCSAYNNLDGQCYCEAWGDDDCEFKEVTATVSFYVYRIDDGTLSGITSSFEESEFDAIRVIDAKTGRKIYEYVENKDRD